MKSLRNQYIVRFLITWLIAAGTLFLLFHFCGKNLMHKIVKTIYVENAWDELSEIDIESLKNGKYENSEDEETLEDLEERVRFILCNEEGEAVYAAEEVRYTEELKKQMAEHELFSEEPVPVEEKNEHRNIISLRGKLTSDGVPYYLLIYKNLRHLNKRLEFAEAVSLIVLLLSTFLMAILVLIIGRKQIEDLRSIKNQMEGIVMGDYSLRTSIQGGNELSQISEYANKAADLCQNKDTDLENYRFLLKKDTSQKAQLEAVNKERTRAITHQLKTPLAIISSQVELNQDETDEVKRQYYYNSIMEEIDKMSGLITGILQEETQSGGGMQKTLRRICLSDLLLGLVPKYENWLKTNQILFSDRIDPNIYIIADPALIEQAVHNYIMNAYNHTSPGRQIILSLHSEEDLCVLGIYNDGDGIAETEREKIWERGYRSEEKTTSGSGIGLYIVKEIVTLHGGDCGAENEPSGVLFWMRFPVSSLDKTSGR